MRGPRRQYICVKPFVKNATSAKNRRAVETTRKQHKTNPTARTIQTDGKYRLRVALLAMLIAAAVIALVAFFGAQTIQSSFGSAIKIALNAGFVVLDVVYGERAGRHAKLHHQFAYKLSNPDSPKSEKALRTHMPWSDPPEMARSSRRSYC